jgi:riboflavin biosynthesis pyrimidine reductase
MQEISKILSQTLELRKLEKLGEKYSYLDLILKMRWESLQILRDLAENQCRSVWVERK